MFLSIGAQASDDGGDRSPWGQFWFEPVPFRGGVSNITGDLAMQLSAVYSCVRVHAESFASLPFVLYRKVGKDKNPITDHWLAKLMKRPNAFQNGMEFREMMHGHVVLRGNAFAQIIPDTASGEVSDLIPLHPDRVRIEMLSDSNWRYRVRNRGGDETLIPRGGMFHLRGLSGDGIVGYNPIELSRRTLAGGIAAQDYGVRFFDNDARPGGWLEHPGEFPDDDTRRAFRERWQEMQTGQNRKKVAVLEYGLKFHEVGVTNEDSQFLETKKFSRSEIAGLFRVPSHMINDLEKATLNNVEQLSLEFIKFGLMPWQVRWEEALQWHFLDPDDDADLEIDFPTRALERADVLTRSKLYHAGILDGWMTRNEVRAAEDMNPLPGLDEPLRPLNMVEESDAEPGADGADAGDGAGDDAPPALPAPGQAPAVPGKPDSRLLALALASAERVARKETAMLEGRLDAAATLYHKHADFIANALSVTPAAARAYCAAQLCLLTATPNMPIAEFTEIARAKLARLAMGVTA